MNLDTFSEKFDLFADAPNAVAKMRELILQLAVQGRLVDPAEDDEPVENFLRRTWARASGKLFKRSGAEKAQPFRLPAHWRWVVLAEVAEFSIGKTPPRGDSGYWYPEDHSWVSIADMKHYGTITETKEKVSALAAQEVFRQRFAEAGSILMSFKLTIGKVARAGIRCFHNEAIISLQPQEPELADYLFRFLPIFAALQTSNNAIKGSTLNKGLLTLLPIALPPLPEQKRIVAKVDELMALCDRVEAQQRERDTRHATLARASLSRFAEAPTPSHLNILFYSTVSIQPSDLRKSILTLAVRGKLVPQDPNEEPATELLTRLAPLRAAGTVTDQAPRAGPFELPVTWRWAKLGDFLESMSNGIYKPARFFSETGTACVRMFNIQDGRLDLTTLKRLDLTPGEVEQYRLTEGDLLVNRVNSRELVGKCAVVPQSDEPLVFEAMNIRVRLTERRHLPGYVNLVLRTDHIRALFQESSKQAIGQASINQPQIARLLIPIPPLAEQRRIVAKVDQLLAVVDQLETQLAASRTTAEKLMDALVAELTATPKGPKQ
jgi:type I restriction enzyme, S subunit